MNAIAKSIDARPGQPFSRALVAPVKGQNVTIPAISHLVNWTSDKPVLAFVAGFHTHDGKSTWSRAESSLIVSGRTTVFLTCNYLRVGEKRKVSIECEGEVQSIVLEEGMMGCYQVEIGTDHPALVRFSADAEVSPLQKKWSSDHRELSFELWFAMPKNMFVANRYHNDRHLVPTLYCVFDSKKEEDSLRPVHAGLLAAGLPSVIVDAPTAINNFQLSGAHQGDFLVSSATAYMKLVNSGLTGRFMYTEHGASPLKRYTYESHYRRYDLVLLPGQLWVDRLQRLYPETSGRGHAVGYAKVVSVQSPTAEQRAALCEKLKLDPTQPVVLFAPSWSGGNRGRGVFNVTAFDKTAQVLTIPHDGDVQFVEELRAQGHNCYSLAQGETISEYYGLADVLVSDVSSTAIEFAALGKPVLCLQLDSIPDFDARFNEGNGRIRIPHTERYWDFCPVVPREQINEALGALLEGVMNPAAERTALPSVEDVLRCTGEASVALNVKAIAEFLSAPLALNEALS
jgi:hypothetical protein